MTFLSSARRFSRFWAYISWIFTASLLIIVPTEREELETYTSSFSIRLSCVSSLSTIWGAPSSSVCLLIPSSSPGLFFLMQLAVKQFQSLLLPMKFLQQVYYAFFWGRLIWSCSNTLPRIDPVIHLSLMIVFTLEDRLVMSELNSKDI